MCLCKIYTRSERACLCRSGYALKCIVPRLFENYTRGKWACLHSSGYVLEYTVRRLCQKYACSEWAWLYASGYPLKCIALLFPIGTRNLHSSHNLANSLPLTFAPASEMAWELATEKIYSYIYTPRKFQRTKRPGRERTRKRIGPSLIGRFAPGSELARERKGSVPNLLFVLVSLLLFVFSDFWLWAADA